ncbi:MAG: polysaccharide biosynthesis tyrosine autokinase [Cellvibrionaceae bacterium]|nr:polysaccharide biosynthesis tyrosine autokinase [Cellvibrionaceae bacterium]
MDMSHSPYAAASSSASSEGLDFNHYFRLLWHNKWKILLCMLVFTGAAIALVKPLKSVYQADATVMIELGSPSLLSLPGDSTGAYQGREYLATQFAVVRSRALMGKVIDRLDLVTHPEYDFRQHEKKKSWLSFLKQEEEEPELSDEAMDVLVRRHILNIFEYSLITEPVFGTHLLKIEFQSHDPDLSANVVNAMADLYIESYLEAKLESTQKATAWLSGRLSELRKNLQLSEEKLQQYRETEQLVDVQGVRTLDAAELAQLREDFVDARQQRANAQAVYDQVRNATNLSAEELLAIPAILNNTVVQRLVEVKATADRNVAQLSNRYGPRHASMIAAVSQQQDAENNLQERLLSVTRGIRASYEAALKTERSIEGQINATRLRLQDVSRKEVRLRELEREVETNRQLYDLFLSRGKETDERSRLEEPPARIIDPAIVPYEPVGPDKKKYIIAALALSIALSVGVLILLDLLDSTIRTTEDVESRLKMPMLGFLPLFKGRKNRQALRIFSQGNDQHGFSEAVRSIRTSIVLSSLEDPYKVILVTSSLPDEGKSTVSINLAEAMGQMEKVLLLECDLRKPSLTKALGIPSSTVGLSNILQGQAKLFDCTVQMPGSQIDIIPAGIVPQNPLELLGSRTFKQALSELKTRYDRIIIDSAPVHLVSDAQILSSQVDSLVYVVKSNVTSTSIAAKGIKMLQQVNAPLTGVVLNQVDIKKSTQYDSFYGVYAQNYGYSETPKQA